MPKKKHEAEKEPNAERWLLTYADLITLLMIFFVVMYALSSVSATKFKVLSQSLSKAFGGGNTIMGEMQGTQMLPPQFDYPPDVGVQAEADNYLTEVGLNHEISTSDEQRGVVLTFQDQTLFAEGSAEILPGARDKLLKLARFLNSLDNYLRVEGHTDDIPISGGKFSSNWALSAARAVAVTEILVNQGAVVPKRIVPVGYGDLWPRADNAHEAGRAANRRVEVVILPTHFDPLVPYRN